MKWEFLLSKALVHLGKTPISDKDWNLGGGTVLMFYYKHRLSKDIDIFVNDVQLLAYTSPKISSPIESMIVSYIDSTLFTKLVLKEGEIDFIFGAKLTNCPDKVMNFEGRSIAIQHPVEIVAKKVHYRGDDFAVRDVYDLSVVAQHEKAAILANRDVFIPKMNTINDRLDMMLQNKALIENSNIIPYDDKLIQLKEHIYNVKALIKELSPSTSEGE